jgi:hypothetical protein
MSTKVIVTDFRRRIIDAQYVTLRCQECGAGVALDEEPGGDLVWVCVNMPCGYTVVAGVGLEAEALLVEPGTFAAGWDAAVSLMAG